MARVPAAVAVARPRSDVYVGMLALSAFATFLGCVLLTLELTEYDWVTSPPKAPALTVPVDSGPRPTPADGTPNS